MAKFCTKCGRPLQEGEICNCQTVVNNTMPPETQMEQNAESSQKGEVTAGGQQSDSQQAQEQANYQYQPRQSAPSAQPSQAGAFFQRLFSNILLLLKEPATMGKEFVKSADIMMALSFIVIQGLLSGLFGLVVESKVSSYISSMLGWASELFGTSSMEMPYAKAFFGTVAISVILTVILAALLWAVNMIFKNQVSFQEMLCEAAMRSICIIPVAIIAVILLLLNPVIGIVVFFSANIWGIVVISQINPVRDESRNNFIPLALYLAFFVFMLISCYLMYKCVGMYIPEELGTSISEIISYMD